MHLSIRSDNATDVRLRQKEASGYGLWYDIDGAAFVGSDPGGKALVQGTGVDAKLYELLIGTIGTYSGTLTAFYYSAGALQFVQDFALLDGLEPRKPPLEPSRYIQNLAGQTALVYVTDSEGLAYNGSVATTEIAIDGDPLTGATNPAVHFGLNSPGWYLVTLTAFETNNDRATVIVTGTAGETGRATIDFNPVPEGGGGPVPQLDGPVSTVPLARQWNLRLSAYGSTAANVVTVIDGFDDWLQMDFSMLLNPGDAIAEIASITDTSAGASSSASIVSANRQKAQVRLSGLAPDTESTIRIAVTTEQASTLVGDGVLLVQA